jgi:hypothetical protein
MDEQQKMERLRLLVAQERSEHIQAEWWYLSFAEPGKFKGGVIVLAHGLTTAVLEATRLRISPHGEVRGIPIPSEYVPEPKWRNRLLTLDQLTEIWGEMAPLSELEKEV